MTDLCKGFMVRRNIETDPAHPTPNVRWVEDHYAVMDNGDVFVCTDLRAPTQHFGAHQDGTPGDWYTHLFGDLPAGAEFIGNYPVDAVLGPESE